MKVYLRAHLARSEGRASPCGVTDIPSPPHTLRTHTNIHLPFKALRPPPVSLDSLCSLPRSLYSFPFKRSRLLPLRPLAPLSLSPSHPLTPFATLPSSPPCLLAPLSLSPSCPLCPFTPLPPSPLYPLRPFTPLPPSPPSHFPTLPPSPLYPRRQGAPLLPCATTHLPSPIVCIYRKLPAVLAGTAIPPAFSLALRGLP